jgi:hypothetical protein
LQKVLPTGKLSIKTIIGVMTLGVFWYVLASRCLDPIQNSSYYCLQNPQSISNAARFNSDSLYVLAALHGEAPQD